MFQKEVAERIIAKTNTKSYGRISILASWKMNIKKVKDIKPKSFYPSPKVESTILIMEPRRLSKVTQKIGQLTSTILAVSAVHVLLNHHVR